MIDSTVADEGCRPRTTSLTTPALSGKMPVIDGQMSTMLWAFDQARAPSGVVSNHATWVRVKK